MIVGGGLSGIAAALRCADAGAQVTLLEVRPRLGGAAYSVRRDGLLIDNGQHVFLRCCTAYRGLLARLGSEGRVRLQSRLEIPLLMPGGRREVLRRGGLPAPLHLAGALLRYAPLSMGERLRAALAVRALSRLDPGDPAVDARAMGQWLAEQRQSERAIRDLWDLVVLPTVNLRAEEASLGVGAFVFQRGLLESAEAGDIGFHASSLSETIGEPALRTLKRAGVDVRLRWRAQRVAVGALGGAARAGAAALGAAPAGAAPLQVHGAAGSSSERIDADAAILALPHRRAAAMLPEQASELARRISSIGVCPIVNLHVLYDRRVLDVPFAAGVRSPIQYVFDRTVAGGAAVGTQYVAMSLSGAEAEMGMSVEQLRERYLAALAEALPKARDAKVVSFFATREHAATFRAAPGVGALRPGPLTPVPGLMLAGAWTDTGWPATMESAVLSGEAAASQAISHLGGPAGDDLGAPAQAGAREDLRWAAQPR